MKTVIYSFTIVCLLTVVSFLLFGCASSESATEKIPLSSLSSSQIFKQAIKGLVSGGYEIRAQDESSGVIQAFRPMTGAFSRPGYGHKVSILIDDKDVTVTEFPMEGVVGGESPEEIEIESTS